MKDEIVSKENLSKELLKEIFEAAYFNVSLDKSGELVIKEQYSNYIDVDKNNRFINFYCNIIRNEKSGIQERHKYINDVNWGLIAIRVAEREEIFSYDYYLWVEGGVTKKNIIMTFKNFTTLVDSALEKDEYNVLG